MCIRDRGNALRFLRDGSRFYPLQFAVLHDYLDATAAAQALRQLLRQVHRAVLAAGAAEGNHQIFEAAVLILADAGIYQR